MHRLMEFYLADSACRLDIAFNGRMALDKILKNKYRLILTDLMMPGLDGITFIKSLRISDPLIPVIVTSASNEYGISKEALQAGANEILEKPFDRSKLTKIIKKYLSVKTKKNK
jgi:CheY-like chemotaxis protein